MSPYGSRRGNRRDFLKDGLRAVLVSGFVFTGILLGGKSRGRQGIGSSSAADLPCRYCSELKRCRKPEAERERRKREVLE